jgi:glycosyltransferase involved in cell wall biosynthesis
MSYDLIIVSQSKGSLIQVTQNCIDSARRDGAELNIIIVETGQPYKYDVDKIIEYNGAFNYNRALNLGLKYAKGDIHILANNDIIFHPGWSQIGDLMKSNGYHSASVLSQDARQKDFQRGDFVYEGYRIGYHLTGWCIFVDAFCIQEIGKLDDSVAFWYSDDLYACQLQSAGIRHGLFCNIQVDHITSSTLSVQNAQIQRQYKRSELSTFNQRKQYYAKREGTYKDYSENIQAEI